MSLRAVLAVALSLAILGVAVPGIDRAAERRTADGIRTEVGAVADAGESLLDRDELAPAGSPGARRVVVVALPSRSWHAAGVDYVSFGGPPAERTGYESVLTGRVAFGLRDGPQRSYQLPVPVRPAGDRPLVLREAGRHRLVLELGRHDGERVVVVERAD